MKYEGLVIRPPSEADSLILQVTVGCSHNKCIFCPAYKAKRFRIKSFGEIKEDIDEASIHAQHIRRVFLADGDALIIPQQRLLEIINYLNAKLPKLRRIGIYGNAKSILKKSIEQLEELKENKLIIIYLGIESGDEVTLKNIQKGITYEKMVEAARRVKEASIKLSEIRTALPFRTITRAKNHDCRVGFTQLPLFLQSCLKLPSRQGKAA